jgi:carbon starvation protein
MAFTTFVYDTLDVCTRLGRYIIEELTGWHGRFGRWLANGLTAGVPLFFVMRTITDAQGRAIPAWKAFWPLFGASNQLLAALTLLGITVWLVKKHRARWAWLVTGLPMAFMYVMSVWALAEIVRTKFMTTEGLRLTADPVPWVALILVGLAVLMLVEAARVLWGVMGGPPAPSVNAAASVE